MKRNYSLVVLFVILASVSAYLYYSNRFGTYSEELSNFAIQDTASITKIFLADKNQKQVTLTREHNGQWLVNGKYIARTDAINTLLFTVFNVDVRSPVGRSEKERVIKLMSANAIKCEIYAGDNKLITYYVGAPTADLLGTYMYIEGSSVPFVTHIPGFNGYLSTRYFTKELEWRERFVFHYNKNEIGKIEVTDNSVSDGNYSIIYNNTKSDFDLVDKNGNTVSGVNPDRMNMYLSYYDKVMYEGYTEFMRKEMFDSLLTTGWFRKIKVTDRKGQSSQATFYRKPITERSLTLTDPKGDKPEFDMDRMLTRLNNDTIMVTTQYQLLDKLFRKPDDFKK